MSQNPIHDAFKTLGEYVSAELLDDAYPESVTLLRGLRAAYDQPEVVKMCFPNEWVPPVEILTEAADRAMQPEIFPLPYDDMLLHFEFKKENPFFSAALGGFSLTVYITRAKNGDIVMTPMMMGSPAIGEPRTPVVFGAARQTPGETHVGLFIADRGTRTAHLTPDERTALLKKTLTKVAKLTIGALWSLMARGVQTEQVKPISKLDKNNRRGVPKRQGYTKIIIDEPRKHYLNDDPTGTHASPRPHWRRGHLRTVSENVRTYVRPHMVGAKAGDYCEPGVRMYKCELAARGLRDNT